MKIQELRNLLKEAEREPLEKAFAESYKHFSKSQKEEIDQLILDIFQGKDVKKAEKKGAVDFDVLEQEIRVFMSNAYDQNYFAPNKIIPKSQRPKWRFLVKGYIKELEKITPQREEYARAVKLLMDLYHLICYACNYYLFSTDDPFRSIGWKQTELFLLTARKTFEAGYTRENIAILITEASTGGVSRESLHIEQQIALVGALKTSDVKYMAVEEAKKLVEERKGRFKGMSKNNSGIYTLQDEIDNLCIMILLLAIELAEPEEGIRYFFDHSEDRDKEVTLYRALDTARWAGDDEGLWIQIYEYGLKKKIKPRGYLVQEYQKIKENQRLKDETHE